MIHNAGTSGNNLKPGGGSEGLRSTKDGQASAGNFVRGFSSFPINKLILRGATVGAERSPSKKRCFVFCTSSQENTKELSIDARTKEFWMFAEVKYNADELRMTLKHKA